MSLRMILAGWKVHYNAEAVVEHSHGYTPLQEFQRYFDVGTFHAREHWVMGRLERPMEGLRFVLSEWRICGQEHSYLYLSSRILAWSIE
jgi:rhamnosyltransferase